MKRYDKLFQLLKPSRFEVTISLLLSIVILGLLATPILYKGSDFETYFNYIEQNPTAAAMQYQEISTEINSSDLAASVSVFFVWALVGLVGYVVIISFIRIIALIAHFRSELSYSNTDKMGLMIEAIVHVIVRLAAAGSLYIFAVLSLMHTVPLLVILTRSISVDSLALTASICLVVVGIIMMSIHVTTVLLRLVMLRTRLYYIS